MRGDKTLSGSAAATIAVAQISRVARERNLEEPGKRPVDRTWVRVAIAPIIQTSGAGAVGVLVVAGGHAHICARCCGYAPPWERNYYCLYIQITFQFIKFLLSFFFLQDCITKCCRQLASKLPTSPQNNNENSRRLSVPTENPGKILTEGEQELLKCAGLDTYLLESPR